MKHKSHLEQDWMRHAGSVIAFSKLSTNQITPQRNFCPRPNMHSKSQNHSRCCGRRSKELAFKRRWWSLCERVGTEVWLDLREAERQQSLSQLSVYSGTWVFIRLLMIRFVSAIPSFASCFCFFTSSHDATIQSYHTLWKSYITPIPKSTTVRSQPRKEIWVKVTDNTACVTLQSDIYILSVLFIQRH